MVFRQLARKSLCQLRWTRQNMNWSLICHRIWLWGWKSIRWKMKQSVYLWTALYTLSMKPKKSIRLFWLTSWTMFIIKQMNCRIKLDTDFHQALRKAPKVWFIRCRKSQFLISTQAILQLIKEMKQLWWICKLSRIQNTFKTSDNCHIRWLRDVNKLSLKKTKWRKLNMQGYCLDRHL